MAKNFRLVLSAGKNLRFHVLNQAETLRVETDVFWNLNLQSALDALNALKPDQSLIFLSPILDFRVIDSSLDLIDQLRVGSGGFRALVMSSNDHFDLVCCDNARNYFRLSKTAGVDDVALVPLSHPIPLDQNSSERQIAISVIPTAQKGQIELRLAPLCELRIEQGLTGLSDAQLRLGEYKSGFTILTLSVTEECQICFSPDGRSYFRLTKKKGSDTFEVQRVNTPQPVRLSGDKLQFGIFVTPPAEGRIEVHITPVHELRNPCPFNPDSHLGEEKNSLVLVWEVGEEASCVFSPDQQRYFFLQKSAGQATVTMTSTAAPSEENEFDAPTKP
jgi:hypothetical protein